MQHYFLVFEKWKTTFPEEKAILGKRQRASNYE